jgi:hypothetical protein
LRGLVDVDWPGATSLEDSGEENHSMTERNWELYRLSVVERLADSPYKEAVVSAIKHKLSILGYAEPSPRKCEGGTAAG